MNIKLNQIKDKNGNYVLGFVQELVIALVMNGKDFEYHPDGIVLNGVYAAVPRVTDDGYTVVDIEKSCGHRGVIVTETLTTIEELDTLVSQL